MVSAENRSLESRFFPEAEKDYAQIDNSIVFDNVSVNTPEGVDLIRQLDADIVVNLGGAIYREPFISACKLILNYHSGLSPIYNGSGTINFAFSNGHPYLCGGTLMTMSPVIDGGRILAHYLPEIEAGDTPASLNMKTYAGAPLLYDRFLSDFAERKTYSSIPQQKPLFYVRAADWTLYQTLRVRRHLRLRLAAKYARPAQVVEYWKQPDDQKAGDLLTKTLSELLWES
jgi:methionyl-tRNA formyltransferase